MTKLVLISHALCPYVQRAAIAMIEKGMSFERRVVDLANKPNWFLAISPLGKTPVLIVDGTPIFESVAILEFLEETGPKPLYPKDPLRRAESRGWIEFGSAILNDIAGLYSATDANGFEIKRQALTQKFARVETTLGDGPYFSGKDISVVDAVFAPVFRYFDVFDAIEDFEILAGKPKLEAWRLRLARRQSVKMAVGSDYNELLQAFLVKRNSYLSSLMQGNDQKLHSLALETRKSRNTVTRLVSFNSSG